MGTQGPLVCFKDVKHTHIRCVICLKSEVTFARIKVTGAVSSCLYGRKGNTPKGEVNSSPGRREVLCPFGVTK